MTVTDLITDALSELNIVAGGDTPAAADTTYALGKLNQILDNWNADRFAVYADRFATNTITASLNPHTIGPTGATWTETVRPVDIVAASVILNVSTPYPYVSMTKRDAQWWQNQPSPTLTATIPTDFYYNPTWPNGSFYMWPVPTTAYQVQLQIRVLLSQVALTDTFTMPPGYRNAVMLTLAEDLAGPFRKVMTPDQKRKAMDARARIFHNNIQTPLLMTNDTGMPSGTGAGRPNFFWPNGQLTNG